MRSQRPHIFRSRSDFALNEHGLKQAELLAEELRKVNLGAVYSSPLARALQTAEPISRAHGIEPVIEEAFNNIDLGPWEGVAKEEIAERYPEEFNTFISRFEELKIKGAETLIQVQQRSLHALCRLTRKHAGRAFAVVTHHIVLIPIIAGLLEIPPPYFFKFRPRPAALTIFEHTSKRGYTLTNYNLTGHLE